MTSRELNERVGGFRQNAKEIFWLEDEAYIADIAKLGYGAAYLQDLKLLHAGGSFYAAESVEKDDYWRRYWLRELRKNAVKRLLLRLPFVRTLNDRYRWFRLSEIPEAVVKAL